MFFISFLPNVIRECEIFLYDINVFSSVYDTIIVELDISVCLCMQEESCYDVQECTHIFQHKFLMLLVHLVCQWQKCWKIL